ncbi:uncharacterized protein V1516DRAFT_668504 [Lipomyces oligophaga]|uniref:uncharacterized protein n=1 Tax=Lipomyces oligophaga TaxID=45792 RepID=UPI0034CE28B9
MTWPASGAIKYYHTFKPAPATTRVDISQALEELLARANNHIAEQISPNEVPQQKKEIGTQKLIEKEKDPLSISNKAKKREIRKETTRRKIDRAETAAATIKEPKPSKPNRQAFWFEKYLWFLSSDGYLVLCGRYAYQSAVLLKRHLGPHDIIVSADVPGSEYVVVLNHLNVDVVPPSTIMQAATLAVSTSIAWETNGAVEAWWCRSSSCKVSTNVEQALAAESDVELELNVIIDKKVKIGVPPLIMGYGFMFIIDDASADRRAKLRSDAAVLDLSELALSSTDEPATVSKLAKIISISGSDAGSDAEEDHERSESKDIESSDDYESTTESATAVSRDDTPVTSSIPRGKKSKLKKIATKYAEQDDEDRNLRMQLLGSANSNSRRQEAESVRRSKREAREAEERAQKMQDEEAKLKNRDRRKEVLEKQRVPLNSLTQLLEEDRGVDFTLPIRNLVAKPDRDDVLVAAIAVCAPWPALHKLKYKIKLMPGMGKRGKTLRKCTDFFVSGMGSAVDFKNTDKERCWKSEVQLIGALDDTEIGLPVGIQKFRVTIPSGKPTNSSKPKLAESGKSGNKKSSKKNGKQ